jgi:hypothetical protein
VGAEIDNGTHAILASNATLMRYLKIIGAHDTLSNVAACGLKFADTMTGQAWSLRPFRAPPTVGLWDVARAASLLLATDAAIADDVLRPAPTARQRLWEPLCTAALNTPLAAGSAKLLARVVSAMAAPRGLWHGLLVATQSLSRTFIDPAASFIARHGGRIHASCPVRAIDIADGMAKALRLDEAVVPVAPNDVVIVAVPPWSPLLAPFSLPDLPTSPIVHGHFKLPVETEPRFMGLVGGQGQWLLQRGAVASVTVSAADHLVEMDADAIAAALWPEIAPQMGMPNAPLPPYRVIKERRATLRHTPTTERSRPGPRTRWPNVVLAGDWTATGLPCTLESAVASGFAAANLVPI